MLTNKKLRQVFCEEEEEEESAEENARIIGGQKIERKKTFSMDSGSGIFDRRGKMLNYGSQSADKKIARTLRTGAREVSVKKQREFMQLLEKYHGCGGGDSMNMKKDEIVRFEAGLRRGSSDASFDKLSQNMKREGLIKNSSDVKRFFKRSELKKMKNALLGQKDRSSYRRNDRTELINRRSGSSSSSRGSVR